MATILTTCCDTFDQLPFEPGKPSLILANTVKGKGISYMENVVKWHHHVPTRRRVRNWRCSELDAAKRAG